MVYSTYIAQLNKFHIMLIVVNDIKTLYNKVRKQGVIHTYITFYSIIDKYIEFSNCFSFFKYFRFK